jgi:predicted nucleic acid-binding protein
MKDKMLVSYRDSIIIATAIESGCQTLTGKDLQNRQKIREITIVNIFC